MFVKKGENHNLVLIHKQRLQSQIRKEELQAIKQRGRQQLIQSLASNDDRCINSKEQQIIIYLTDQIQQISETDSQQIDLFIKNYKQTFSYQFRNVFTELVLNKFRKNKKMLTSLINLLHKCKKIQVLQNIQTEKCIQLLFRDNQDQQTNKVLHLYEIVALLYNLFVLINNQAQFTTIINYRQEIQQLGYFNEALILLTSVLTSKKIYEPTNSCIQFYLQNEFTLDLDKKYIQQICNILIHYYSKSRQLQIMPKFLKYFNIRFKQQTIPKQLKEEFLIILINHFQTYSQQDKKQFIQMIIKLETFTLVCQIMINQQEYNKQNALKIVFYSLSVLPLKNIKVISEQYSLVEIIINFLPIILDINLLFKAIESLFYIFESDQCFIETALSLGIKKIICHFATHKNVKISSLCIDLLQNYL